MDRKNLKLNGTSEDDIKVISAHLQDSITQVKNIAHLKKNKIFLIQFNRFMWEDVEKGVFRKNKRIISVLKFENVINVNSKNLNQKNTERFLDFLAIETKLLSDMKDSTIRNALNVVGVNLLANLRSAFSTVSSINLYSRSSAIYYYGYKK